LDEMESPEFFEAAARALINERCAPAFLHDVRGSMQALFSALELLGRSARMGNVNPLRVEKACDLAQRAIVRHEKSTLEILQLLTLQQSKPVTVDFAELLQEAAHLLRNDAAVKGITITTLLNTDLAIRVEKARLHILMVGLFTAAIDEMTPGGELTIGLQRSLDDAAVTIGYHVTSPKPLQSAELTMRFARQFIDSNAGCMQVDLESGGQTVIRLRLPCITPVR
jgi:signal transduction histidine kinase